MGQTKSALTSHELSEYEELTFLRRSEILKAHETFKKFDPSRVARNRNAKIPCDHIQNQIPELMLNPFGDRVCKVFSSSKDNHLTFEDYLDMISVFSDRAPLEVKTAYAFRIYDFDNDGVLGHSDLREIITRLVGTSERHLTNSDVCKVIDNVLKEVDVDEDGFISFPEFDHTISKCPDFPLTFRMCLV